MKLLRIELDKVLNDDKSGSTELLLKSIKLIEKNIDELKSVNQIISELKVNFRSFEIFKEFTGKVDSYITRNDKEGLRLFLVEFKDHLSNSIKSLYLKNQKLLDTFNSIITLSNSKTISSICKSMNLNGSLKKVFIAESRPKFEGRKLARSLLRSKIDVVMFTDFLSVKYLQMSDAVLIGSDKVLSNRNVINKTGSLNLSILAKEFNIPFYVLATKDKFSSVSKYRDEKKPAEEVWNFSHSGLKISNSYFEEVDFKYITKILTD